MAVGTLKGMVDEPKTKSDPGNKTLTGRNLPGLLAIHAGNFHECSFPVCAATYINGLGKTLIRSTGCVPAPLHADIILAGGSMSKKTPAIISALATFILLAITGFVLFVAQIVVLNGVLDEGKVSTSIGMGVVCQGISLLLASAFAAWFANTLIMKFDWSKAMAVIAAVIVGTLLGASISLISIVISIPMAGIR